MSFIKGKIQTEKVIFAAFSKPKLLEQLDIIHLQESHALDVLRIVQQVQNPPTLYHNFCRVELRNHFRYNHLIQTIVNLNLSSYKSIIGSLIKNYYDFKIPYRPEFNFSNEQLLQLIKLTLNLSTKEPYQESANHLAQKYADKLVQSEQFINKSQSEDLYCILQQYKKDHIAIKTLETLCLANSIY